MKKCIDAVRYGLETLGVSSDKLFHLIKTSKGYDGDNYERWLASKIIEVAEADGVGFSQLLVKKFHILSSLSEEEGLEIREDYLKFFTESICLNREEVYTVGFKGYEFFEENRKMDEFDWFAGVDYDDENIFFTKMLPVDLKDKVMKGEFPFIFKIGLEPVSKKSELFCDAKNRCIPIKYYGSLLLHRMCLLYDVFGNTETRFLFISPVEFLYDEDNQVLFKELLSRYDVRGYDVSDLNPYLSEHAVCVCTAKKSSKKDYISLNKMQLRQGEDKKVSKKERVYTKSNTKMLNYLYEKYKDDESDEWGYLRFGKGLTIESEKVDDGATYIPITSKNLLETMGYFGMYKANEENGYFTDLNVLVSGHSSFSDMVYNCLPLVLFDYDSRVVLGESKFYYKSGYFKAILEKAEVSFSFEAKELMDIGIRYLERIGDRAETMNFQEVRKSVSDDQYDRMYYTAVDNLKKYICSTYKELY